MIAGCIPAFPLDVEGAIVKIAGGILRDHCLHILSASDGEHVYYFAVPSKWVTHAEKFETQLAMALPGHPEHRGDGIYVLDVSPIVVAVIKRRGEFLLLCDEASAIDKIAQDSRLEIYNAGTATTSWPLESLDGYHRGIIGNIVNRFARLATYVTVGCIVLYASLTLVDVLLDQFNKDKVLLGSTAEAVKHIQYASPMSEQLAQIQKISATVVRAGGWIDGYIWKQGKGEAFEIFLPGWVSRDYMEALGPGIVTDYNIPDNLVVARKGNLEEMSKP